MIAPDDPPPFQSLTIVWDPQQFIPGGESVTYQTQISFVPIPTLATGGFQLGESDIYNGSLIVSRSIKLGTPIVWVSVNYRVNMFGFPVGKAADEAGIGNLGLLDRKSTEVGHPRRN